VTLLTQVVGVLGAVALIALLVHGTASRTTIASSTAALAAVVVGLLGLQGLWPAAKTANANAKAQRALTPAQITAGSEAGIGVNGPFIDWALAQMGPGNDRFFVAGPNVSAAQAFIGYKALPRLMAKGPRDATWVVFYETTPHKAGFRRAELARFVKYQPTFSVAKLKAPTR
jgi:hypothetical protein